MLNIIFTLIMNSNFTPDIIAEFRRNNVYVRDIPECRVTADGRQVFHALVHHIGQISELKSQLEVLSSVEVIGIWKMDGLQYGYVMNPDGVVERAKDINLDEEEIDVEIPFPFDLSLYANYLNDVFVISSNGEIQETRRPTDEEARSTQINLWAGQKPRDLNVYEF